MAYNPHIHHRKSIRLKGYDYSQEGLYFITICVQDRKCLFGKIENDEMMLNDFGIVANDQWEKLTERFSNFELDVFQIMPNHMHGIIVLNDPVGATLAVVPNKTGFPNDAVAQNVAVAHDAVAHDAIKHDAVGNDDAEMHLRAGASPAPTNATVGDIVGAYKSLMANGCLEIYKSKNETMGKLWQRNYHEHIIRNEKSYQTISDYIINNPAKWNDDKFYKP